MIGSLRERGGLAWTFLWVSGARTTMLAFSLLGSIIIYRNLATDASDMARGGAFAISMAAVRILTNTIGGTADLVVLRRVPVLLTTHPTAAEDIVRASFLLRAMAVAGVTGVAFLIQPWFAEHFLAGHGEMSLVLLVCAAAAGELLLRSVLAFFQASQRFGQFVMFESLFQGGRLLAVLVLIAVGWLTVTTILISYFAMGLTAALLGVHQLPRTLLAARAIPAPVIKEAAGFFGLTLIALSLSACTERLDLFLLSHFRGVAEAGLYGGVLTLAVIPDFVGGLLATVLQPQVVRLRERGELREFNHKVLLMFVPAGLLALAVVAMSGDLIVTIALGPHFAAGELAFKLLATGSIVGLALTSVPSILISMTSPRTTTALTLCQAVILVGLGAFLIPDYGLTGAAALVAATRVTAAVAVMLIGQRMMRLPAAGIPSTN